jgi:branched-chain amino acid transport system permease protein
VAIRDRYLAAEVIGVHVFKYRLMSFAVSSFFAGIAGALMAQYLQVITHESFTIHQSIDFLAMCIIGGLGHILGGIFGVGFWFILERLLEVVTTGLNTAFPDHVTWFVSIREVVFGCVIVLFLIFEPDGLAAQVAHHSRLLEACGLFHISFQVSCSTLMDGCHLFDEVWRK